MKFSRILFILSLIGVLILIAIAQGTPKFEEGKISQITSTPSRMTVYLENSDKKLIIFDKLTLPLQKGDRIIFSGKEETYKNQTQILVDKIVKVSST